MSSRLIANTTMTFPNFIDQAYLELFDAEQRRFLQSNGLRVNEKTVKRLLTTGADLGAARALASNQVDMMRTLAVSTYRFDRYTKATEIIRSMMEDPMFICNDNDRAQITNLINEARRDLNDEDNGKIEILFNAMFQAATGIDPNEEAGDAVESEQTPPRKDFNL